MTETIGEPLIIFDNAIGRQRVATQQDVDTLVAIQTEYEALLLARAAELLDALPPFTASSPREAKWRTTEQLAREMGLFGFAIDRLDRVLRDHEAHCREGRTEAVIRRANYPDKYAALSLWGSTNRHGPPLSGHQPNRCDPPDEIGRASCRARGQEW